MKPEFDALFVRKLTDWNNARHKKVPVAINLTGHSEDKSFQTIAAEMVGHASHIGITTVSTPNKLPGFILSETISFHALPLQKELDPFLNALSRISGRSSLPEEITNSAIKDIDVPVTLKLYIALMCPHCPAMVDMTISMALANPNIRLKIIDGSLFPNAAQKDNIMAAPCLILNDDFRWTGSVSADEVIKMIRHRNPEGLSAKTLKNILEQGDADWITEQMVQAGKIFDAFITLLLHETWSVRLGAMVVVQSLAEKDPCLAQTLCPPLIKLFDKKDVTVQGDIFYAVGEAGNRNMIAWIKEKIPQIDHPDLLDSARDAIETLEDRHAGSNC